VGFFFGDTTLQRIAEPDLMEGVEQAKAYAEADFSQANSQFIQLFCSSFPFFSGNAHILDLGCGPGHILMDFAQKFPGCTCLGIDGSEEMLSHGRNQAANIKDEVKIRICKKL
jgi:cyclopropane fatty-acyl-phospholipid synthase-like methyltransferase